MKIMDRTVKEMIIMTEIGLLQMKSRMLFMICFPYSKGGGLRVVHIICLESFISDKASPQDILTQNRSYFS